MILLVFENSIVCVMDLHDGDVKWQYRVNKLTFNKKSKIIIQAE